MIEQCKMLGVTLSEPEPVKDAELDILICAKHWQSLCQEVQVLSKVSFVIIQKLFVDIETLIIKNDSHG